MCVVEPGGVRVGMQAAHEAGASGNSMVGASTAPMYPGAAVHTCFQCTIERPRRTGCRVLPGRCHSNDTIPEEAIGAAKAGQGRVLADFGRGRPSAVLATRGFQGRSCHE